MGLLKVSKGWVDKMGQKARFEGNSVVTIESLTEARPEAGDVRIAVAFCAACGSDNRLLRNGTQVVPGHEISGVVDAVGPDTDPGWMGARVAVYIPLYCGTCLECQKGKTHQCERLGGLIGWQRDGGYESSVCIPARNVWRLPDDIGLDEAPLLLDTLGTTGHAIDRCLAIVQAPQTALILGFGPLGFGSSVVLRDEHIRNIVVVDPNPERIHGAAHLGLEAYRAVDPHRKFTVVIEASGSAAARDVALQVVASEGAIVLLGESDKPWTVEPNPSVRRKDFALVRSFYFPYGRFEKTARVLRRQRPHMAYMLGERRPLSELQQTLSEFSSGALLKPLTFSESI